MNAKTMMGAPVLGALLLLVACGASQSAAHTPQEPIPGTDGVTMQQGVAFDDVVERISAARCDRDQSCNLVGPGAPYRDRDDCLSRTRTAVRGDINPDKCPGGVGEIALSRCVTSLEAGECDMPGQFEGRAANCHVATLCLAR